ncbi:hypothetical protein EDB81DRAFT_728376 [Dactylonectria macrodidyma]|uniref:Uncharacterized protein n=1 Tax=Dactylonectria macrodidyma TaxID=307937 RepID=A0A9P9E634_9HYPO|nr:hypothetical protein EDB81DRAFT_728376 [Dactylonectria macrodidyma]
MKSSSRRILYATVLAYAIPTLAHFIDPLVTSAEIEVRRAFAAPTPPPTPTHPRHYPRAEEEADDLTKYTVTYAPNSTCGYLSGSVQIPITCENKGVCLWELEYFRFIACEINEDTGLAHTKCLQRDEALDPILCDDVCVSNTYNLFCTNETEPYCRTYAFPQGVRDYRCASTPATRVSSADFTYNGQDYPKWTISTFVEVDGTTISRLESLTTSTEMTSTETTSTESRLVETSSSSVLPAGGNKSGSTNVAAIAGGTAGGFVGGVLVLGLFVYCWRRRRAAQNNTDPPAPPVQQVMSPGSPKDNAPPFIYTSSPTSPSLSRADMSMRHPLSPITIPVSPSIPDQLEVVHELGDLDGQQLSSTQGTDQGSLYHLFSSHNGRA